MIGWKIIYDGKSIIYDGKSIIYDGKKCYEAPSVLDFIFFSFLSEGEALFISVKNHGNEKKKVGGAQTDCVPSTFTG